MFALPVAQDLYTDADGYLERFATSLDETVADRFLLRADRAEVLAEGRDLAQQVFGTG